MHRADQSFKLTETTQILQAGIFQKKRPTSESAADTPLDPFERCLVLPEHRKNAGDLVIRVMSVSKGFWTAKFMRRYRKDTPPLQPLY